MARYLVKGSSASFFIIAFNVGFTFVSSIIVANLAGDYELGRYEYIMTWINLFCIVALFGYHTLAVREIPKLKANKDYEGIRHFWQQSYWWVLLASITTAILGWYALNFFGLIDYTDFTLLKIGMLMVPVWVIALLISGVLRGSKHIINSQLPLQVIRPIIFVLAIVTLAFSFQNEYCTKEEIAYYSISVKIAALMGLMMVTVNLVIGPEISRLYNQNNIKKLEMLLSRSIKLTFGLTLPVALFLVLFGQFVLSLFGKEFVVGYPVLVIFIFVALVNIGAGAVGNILNMTGYEKHVFYGVLISLIFNIALNFTLIPLFGIIGAAISTGTAIIVWNVILWWFVKQKIGINPSIFNFKKFR